MKLNKTKLLNNIAEIREQSEMFLTDKCIIHHLIGENLILGQPTPIYETTENVSCRLIIRSGSVNTNTASQERATQQTMFVGVYRLQLPFGTVVNENDRIEVFDIAIQGYRNFEVTYAPPFTHMTGAYVIGIQEIT